MRPYLRRQRWWGRALRADGKMVRVSLGTRDSGLAVAVTKMLDNLRDPLREFDLLHLIATKQVTAVEVWDAERSGTRAALKARLAASAVPADDPDLAAFIPRWHAALTIGSRDEYRSHVQTFFPVGQTFRRSAFTPTAIRQWVRVKPRKCRASLSSFAAWLVEQDVLPDNPVLTVRANRDYAARERFLSDEEISRFLAALDEPHRTLHSLMLGTGMEKQVILRLTYADIDRAEGTIHARGTKREHRNRVVRVTEGWAWDQLMTFLRDRPGLGQARLFPMTPDALGYAFYRAVASAGITGYRVHDHRHTYAVRALRDGLDEQVIAHQLGHKDASLIRPRYGKFVPDVRDYERRRIVTHRAAGELR